MDKGPLTSQREKRLGRFLRASVAHVSRGGRGGGEVLHASFVSFSQYVIYYRSVFPFSRASFSMPRLEVRGDLRGGVFLVEYKCSEG